LKKPRAKEKKTEDEHGKEANTTVALVRDTVRAVRVNYHSQYATDLTGVSVNSIWHDKTEYAVEWAQLFCVN